MTTDLLARASYVLARARYRAAHRRLGGPPVVVFSIAKTGSSAIASGVRAAGVGDVHQVHDLDPDFLTHEESTYHWTGRPWRIWDAQRLLRRPASPADPWRVISLVRDPIAQSVSAFFQPGVRKGYVHPGATVDELLERFDDRLERPALHWFETHVQPALGIDVYATDFEPRKGYGIIATPHARLLLLRCEHLEVAPAALAELLGHDEPIEVPRVNVGAEKEYAELYQAFRGALRPSPAQLDRAYGSRMVQHFYSSEEIARFRALWTRTAPPATR